MLVCMSSTSRFVPCFLRCRAMLWSMSKSEVVATESAALNGEAVAASGVDASGDPKSIVAVRARLMDGLPELGEVLRPVLEGTPATKVFMLEPLQAEKRAGSWQELVYPKDASWKQIYGSP